MLILYVFTSHDPDHFLFDRCRGGHCRPMKYRLWLDQYRNGDTVKLDFVEDLSHLPGVDGAVAATEGVALGVLDGVQDGLVFGTEVESEHLVEFVHHLGSSAVF
jgi:hypothetical protein